MIELLQKLRGRAVRRQVELCIREIYLGDCRRVRGAAALELAAEEPPEEQFAFFENEFRRNVVERLAGIFKYFTK